MQFLLSRWRSLILMSCDDYEWLVGTNDLDVGYVAESKRRECKHRDEISIVLFRWYIREPFTRQR